MKRKIPEALISILIIAFLIWSSFSYFSFVREIIYEESTAHLKEIFHQANQQLYNLVSVNWSRMRMWVPYLGATENDELKDVYIEEARTENNFTNFFFISRDGNYLSNKGKKGYLELRSELSTLIIDKKPIVVNSVVPNQPEIMVFAIPVEKDSYRGFEYEAIAITFSNQDMVDALKISAFDGEATTLAIADDGRIVLDNSNGSLGQIRNIFVTLAQSKNLNEQDIEDLRNDFTSGTSGARSFELNGIDYYLVYESANFQDWTVVGLVPANVVNASMNRLQSTTIGVISAIAVCLGLLTVSYIIRENRNKLKQKDKVLEARDELFARLSTNINDVFMMVNAEDLKVEYVSENIERLIGLSQSEVYDDIHVISRLLKEDEKLIIFDALKSIKAGEQRQWNREYVHQKTGEVVWFMVYVFGTEVQGQLKFIIDLSDRTKDKKTNQKLEEAVRTAENANKAKTVFLNNMSHDIRTPMNAIIGFTNIALKHNPKPEIQNCLLKISDSSEHLLTLINDVLDISRIESGNIKFDPMPVDIVEVAETVVNITNGFLSNRNICFTTDLGNPPVRYVLADAVRIREVLVNILGNAVKFTPDGGRIDFIVQYEADEKLKVRYTIKDTGVGMNEEFVEHIFDEFSQEESSARTNYKGTGLGMAISKRYVDLMGGTIEVSSKKNEGSEFVVELPLEAIYQREETIEEAPSYNVNLHNIKVLMAEDNDLNAEIATVQLEELGMKISRVSDGSEAVKAFVDNPPGTYDLILMDVMMPKMNGYEAAKAIRNLGDREDGKDIVIIAMTANVFAEDVEAAFKAGMNGHIGKPIIIEEVIRTIARTIVK